MKRLPFWWICGGALLLLLVGLVLVVRTENRAKLDRQRDEERQRAKQFDAKIQQWAAEK